MDKKTKIELISTGIVMGMAFTLIFSMIEVYNGNNNTFIYYMYDIKSPLFMFRDFDAVYLEGIKSGPYPFGYFPSTLFLTKIFTLFPMHTAAYIFLFIFISFFVFLCKKYISTGNKIIDYKNTVIFLFLSYPCLFAIQRLNYEIILFMFVALFVYFYNHKNKWLGILFLSSAVAMKLYPIVFVVLYLADRRFKEIIYVITVSLTIMLVGYSLPHGDLIVNIQAHLKALQYYNSNYAIGNSGLGYGHTLYGAIKVIIFKIWHIKNTPITHTLFASLPVLSGIIFILSTIHIVLFEKVFWKKIALIVFLVCLLPHVSADYKLILVFLPLFLFINETAQPKTDLLYAIIFIALLISKNFPPYFMSNYFNSSIVTTPLIMLFAVFMIILGERILYSKRLQQNITPLSVQ